MENNYTELDYKVVGERIKQLRGIENQSDFAKKFRMSQVDISRIERGDVKPSPELLYNICIKYDMPLNYFFINEEDIKRTPEGRPYISGTTLKGALRRELEKGMVIREPAAAYDLEEYVQVPVARGEISAGGGLIADETVEMRIAVRRDWIERRGDPRNMSLIRVSGDSMEPTLYSGDLVLVDHNRNFIDPQGGIYAIALDTIIMIKRVQVIYPEKKLKIISDNPRYEPTEIVPDQAIINGKVIWFGREIER